MLPSINFVCSYESPYRPDYILAQKLALFVLYVLGISVDVLAAQHLRRWVMLVCGFVLGRRVWSFFLFCFFIFYTFQGTKGRRKKA